jgi:hypothetical protein
MSDDVAAKAPSWFRLLAAVGLVWNGIGVAIYLQSVGLFGDPLAGMNEAERALAASVPAWVTAAFAIAVFSGLFGALALVLLKQVARPLLILSLAAVLTQTGWIVLISDARAVHGLAVIAMPALIVLIAVGLAWLATSGLRRGWLN